jgi:hypothetical protein
MPVTTPISTPMTDTCAVRARLARIANILDTAIGIPGTRIRFGLDAIIGLIPGVGDVAGVALGLWMLWQARSLNAPTSLQVKMLANLALEGVIGFIPVLGDWFDVLWQSNQRNRALLIEWLDAQELAQQPAAEKKRPWLMLALGACLVLLLGAAVWQLA